MRILVYGAGAVGGFFGGLLAGAGEDVRFVARGAQLEALRSTGLVNLRPEDIDEHLAWTERATGLKTSTMVDRERGRAMESDGLLGVIVRTGRETGVETPYSSTIYALLTAIDEGR